MQPTKSDTVAERAVLGGICTNGQESFIDVDDLIDVKCFTLESNQIIYSCIKHIFAHHSKPSVDLPSVLSAANDLGLTHFNKPSEASYLKGVIAQNLSQEKVRHFAAKLRKLQITRRYYDALEEAQINLAELTGNEPLNQIIGTAEQPLFDLSLNLSQADANSVGPMGQDVDSYLDNVENNPREIMGISSGWPIFDKSLGGGFIRGGVSVVGARSKIGKSFIADNVCWYISNTLKIPTLNLDTEMNRVKHQQRVLANISGIEINDIKTGKYAQNPIYKRRVREAAELLKLSPYDYASISGQEFEETASLIRRWILQRVGKDANGNTGDCLLIYDYIKLMNASTVAQHMQEYQALGFIMTSFHNICAKYDVPALAFVQLNRDGITKESTDIISGSDRILWLSSNFSLYRKKTQDEIVEDGIENGNMILKPLACRDGEGLDEMDHINLKFEGSIGRITEIGTKFGAASKKSKNTPTIEISDDVPF